MPPRCQLLPGSMSVRSQATLRTQSAPRRFTTSAPRSQKRKGGDLGSHLAKHVIPPNAPIPAYPYGPALLFKQSNKGLYGGQRIQFGNNVSPDSETKTRRHWKPNILTKSLYSVALKKKVKLRLTSKVLKTMDREGGLDEYLLRESETRIKELGPLGWQLRWTLMRRPEVTARFRAEAAAIGLAQEVIDRHWPTTKVKISPEPPQPLMSRKKKDKRVITPRVERIPDSAVINQWLEQMGLTQQDVVAAEQSGQIKQSGGFVQWLALCRAEYAHFGQEARYRGGVFTEAWTARNPEPAASESQEEETQVQETEVEPKSEDSWKDLVKTKQTRQEQKQTN